MSQNLETLDWSEIIAKLTTYATSEVSRENLIRLAPLRSVEEMDEAEVIERKRWYTKVRVSTVIISLGCLLMAAGYFLPAFRNIVGLGAATVFLAIAFRMYFPRN